MASFEITTFKDPLQDNRRQQLLDLYKQNPIPDDELFLNLGLFLVPQTLSRILFLNFLYQKVLEVQGVVFDLGCRWGQNASLFAALRGIYEPFNRLRKIVAFDTFTGFPTVNPKDGEHTMMKQGSYSVSEDYEKFLSRILDIQEGEAPLSHIKKYEIVKGDTTREMKTYLTNHQETVVALAYFDFDLYEPTKECLLLLKDRLTRGSVIAFDELNDHATPGETLAVKEVLGLDRYSLKRFPHNSRTSYLVVGE